MRKIGTSLLLAGLLIVVLALVVYSQSGRTPAVKVLQGGVSHEIPMDITVLVPAGTGVQTVTVPIVLNLNLSIGPVNAVDMQVEVSQPAQFVSPIATVRPTR
jgi:hypothetical protein